MASNLEYRNDLASLKDNLEEVKALLPDNFEQCSPILTDFIKSIELHQTVRSLTDETVMYKGNNGDTVLHAAFRIGEKNIARVVLDKVKSLKNPNYIIKTLLAIDV